MEIKPFFINSNICTDLDDINNLGNYLQAIAFNIGNSYPTVSLIKQLQGGFVSPKHIKNIWKYDFSSQEKDIEIINNHCTHVFLMLQDQIRIVEGYNQVLPFEQIKNFIKKINKPIIVMSIGVNQYFDFDINKNRFVDNRQLEKDFCKKLSPELVNFLHFLSEHTEIIGLRGGYTQQVLNNLGINNTQIIGCPSFYEHGANRIVKKVSGNALNNLLMLSPYNAFKANEAWNLPKNDLRVSYIVQDEYSFLKSFFEKDYVKLLDSYTPDVLKNSHYFSDIESWKHFVSQHQLALGYRIHGSILSINSGVPTLFIPPDIKGLEMAEFMHIPHANLNISNNMDLYSVYNELDLSELNIYYNDLYKNYEKFLLSNGINLSNNSINLYKYDKQPILNLRENSIILSNTICQNELYLKCSGQLLHSLSKANFAMLAELSGTVNGSNKNTTGIIKKKNGQLSFWQQIFSVRNEAQHKVIRIFGLKLKFRRKKCQ